MEAWLIQWDDGQQTRTVYRTEVEARAKIADHHGTCPHPPMDGCEVFGHQTLHGLVRAPDDVTGETRHADRVEALLARKIKDARLEGFDAAERALMRFGKALGTLNPERAKYLAAPTDPDVLAVLKEFPFLPAPHPDEVKDGLVAEVARLRALVRDAARPRDFFEPNGPADCAWCDPCQSIEDMGMHSKNCPAFTPDGQVR